MSAIIATGSVGTLLNFDREAFLDNEQRVFDYLRSHYRTYRELPTAQTVQQETGVRLPVANESLQFYVDQVNDRQDYNIIRDHFGSLRDSLSQHNMAEVTNAIHTMATVVRRRRRGSTSTGQAIDIAQGMGLVVDRLRSIRGTGGVSGITTGWNQFDYITGGYQKSDIITWVARMSMGKTYLILRQALKAHEDGESVLVVTTEMGTEQMARRLAALGLGIDPTHLKTGCISTYVERRIQAFASAIVGADRFKLFSVGMGAKIGAIEALCQEFGPTIVFIDGVYMLKPTEMSKSMNRVEKMTSIYDDLKGLNLDIDLPIVVTSQLNRQAGKGGKDASLETIAYADAIGTHSSVVVAIKHGSTETPKYSRAFEFMKGREGEEGSVEINFRFAPLNMEERSAEEREEDGEVTEQSVAWMGGRRANGQDQGD